MMSDAAGFHDPVPAAVNVCAMFFAAAVRRAAGMHGQPIVCFAIAS